MPDALVLDASVAAKWHLPDEAYAEQALLLLRRFRGVEVELTAPAHILYEVPSSITVATRGREARLSVQQGRAAIEAFLGIPLHIAADAELVAAAYPVAHRVGCAFYDAIYLALAERIYRPLITADAKLYRLVQPLTNTIWIGDYR